MKRALVLVAVLATACSKRASDAACEKSCECKTLGWCGGGADPKKQICAPRNDADCKQSEACTDSGACTRKGARCVPASDADCGASKLCKTLGACTFEDGTCRNKTPPAARSVLQGIIRPKP